MGKEGLLFGVRKPAGQLPGHGRSAGRLQLHVGQKVSRHQKNRKAHEPEGP